MENKNIEDFMSNFLSNSIEKVLSKEEQEFEKYCKLFKERFGRTAYIAEPNGTMKDTIKAIKICIEKNEYILDELLYNCPYKDIPDIKF